MVRESRDRVLLGAYEETEIRVTTNVARVKEKGELMTLQEVERRPEV